jgi:hypothetical protein
MKAPLSIVLLIISLSLPAFCQQTLGQRYFESCINLIAKKDFNELVRMQKEVLASEGVPLWLQVACNWHMAYGYSQMNDTDAVLEAFQKAVALGFNDYIEIQTNASMKPLFSNMRFRKLYNLMTISSAEQAELQWIHQEIQLISNDATSIIAENINRKDTFFTEFPMTSIPTYPSSATIEYLRQLLGYHHYNLRLWAIKSDISRIGHVNSMAIASSIGGGTNLYDQQTAAVISKAMAERSAEIRRKFVAAREFRMPANASNVPRPVPPLP